MIIAWIASSPACSIESPVSPTIFPSTEATFTSPAYSTTGDAAPPACPRDARWIVQLDPKLRMVQARQAVDEGHPFDGRVARDALAQQLERHANACTFRAPSRRGIGAGDGRVVGLDRHGEIFPRRKSDVDGAASL